MTGASGDGSVGGQGYSGWYYLRDGRLSYNYVFQDLSNNIQSRDWHFDLIRQNAFEFLQLQDTLLRMRSNLILLIENLRPGSGLLLLRKDPVLSHR